MGISSLCAARIFTEHNRELFDSLDFAPLGLANYANAVSRILFPESSGVRGSRPEPQHQRQVIMLNEASSATEEGRDFARRSSDSAEATVMTPALLRRVKKIEEIAIHPTLMSSSSTDGKTTTKSYEKTEVWEARELRTLMAAVSREGKHRHQSGCTRETMDFLHFVAEKILPRLLRREAGERLHGGAAGVEKSGRSFYLGQGARAPEFQSDHSSSMEQPGTSIDPALASSLSAMCMYTFAQCRVLPRKQTIGVLVHNICRLNDHGRGASRIPPRDRVSTLFALAVLNQPEIFWQYREKLLLGGQHVVDERSASTSRLSNSSIGNRSASSSSSRSNVMNTIRDTVCEMWSLCLLGDCAMAGEMYQRRFLEEVAGSSSLSVSSLERGHLISATEATQLGYVKLCLRLAKEKEKQAGGNGAPHKGILSTPVSRSTHNEGRRRTQPCSSWAHIRVAEATGKLDLRDLGGSEGCRAAPCLVPSKPQVQSEAPLPGSDGLILVDILVPNLNLVVEIDGPRHFLHRLGTNAEDDIGSAAVQQATLKTQMGEDHDDWQNRYKTSFGGMLEEKEGSEDSKTSEQPKSSPSSWRGYHTDKVQDGATACKHRIIRQFGYKLLVLRDDALRNMSNNQLQSMLKKSIKVDEADQF
ncbi:unnamed protein product [Amoebophrya sp. A25]|nr:unnamed protein product [Amoebophrya sp. A25]|eukprot:GSA25T00025336001.1